MSGLSAKARERLLYLISPIGLLIVWQILLMLGFGDRRFIPAPSDIAVRFVRLIANGELGVHVAVTLYRVFVGFLVGSVPAVAVGLLMGDRCVVMTAQPGRIKEVIAVPFPHPRNLMTLSASAEFGKLKLDIWRVLEDEVNRARAEAEQ